MQRRSLMIALAATVAAGAGRAAWAQEAGGKPFTPEQLDQILAPIALYPDALLAQTLMAASYPLEVVEAARWSKANPALKGDAAVAAVKDKSWDVSVKSLVAFPQVLAQLSDHLDWMQKVGDAMIAQEQDVANSIQRLRARAADAGNLQSSKEQTVSSQGSGTDRTIVIAPANPEVIYVPAYNPNTVYGTWPYPAYPPTYYPPPPGYGYGSALLRGLMFGVGIAAAGAIFGGWNWGRGNSYVNVNVNRAVNIDRNYNVNNINNGRWQHEPIHRKGVAYRDPATRQRFNQTRPGADQRQEFRGRLENQPRPQANARPNPPNRPAGPGPAQRPNVTNRAAGGQHPNFQNHAGAPRGGGAIRGTNNGQQVNREAARGRAQQSRAATHPSGGGGGARGGGGGGAGGGGGRAGGGNRGGGRQ
ncbi:DUF3300 domain-containing protein [Reyranella sp.]|jgi:hypothetical protein|uniref:DUF3300 domain-containing protein n=1 Tax=Reyranella sp. TaxID=1929291 RepID=UPI000BDB1B5D|nr:DUF3300 domain-containing protein [Reyranella sp.]OYY39504.1 MAG: hypothetical protein B7Y57_19820 [Rhodospirillales bacterium 35-66-84]OYZ92930.1 MAG: hypothetical protein B7Y08_19165 [Rhodospirillales bacterium 24-66-33]OZB24369.1 MAG: hypothetical protein B7X63_15835 [Rhodospirillales bacterium 39-66-50]HQS14567.1 DUF3300 domain-containing protein [Reyranella sp.]HQT12519.1 DUF3300 domain-containing protein [Reyranella sp.]